MKHIVTLVALALAVAACDNTGSNKQGPQTQRQDASPSTPEARCERLEGAAREECNRQTREGGTATPSVATSGDKPVAAAPGGAASARAERGSGTEGATSAGTTSGSQQPLSTGATTR